MAHYLFCIFDLIFNARSSHFSYISPHLSKIPFSLKKSPALPYITPALPSKDHLKNVAQALSKTELCCKNYKEAVKNADKGDFIYLDPPYPPLNETSNFAHYTKERFSKKDQAEVARVSRELSEKGCLIMISNSSVDFIRSLYKKDFNIYELELWRWIRADGKRYKIKEVLITNY